MHVTYWVIAALLAAIYAFGGVKKLVQSSDQLRPMGTCPGASWQTSR